MASTRVFQEGVSEPSSGRSRATVRLCHPERQRRIWRRELPCAKLSRLTLRRECRSLREERASLRGERLCSRKNGSFSAEHGRITGDSGSDSPKAGSAPGENGLDYRENGLFFEENGSAPERAGQIPGRTAWLQEERLVLRRERPIPRRLWLSFPGERSVLWRVRVSFSREFVSLWTGCDRFRKAATFSRESGTDPPESAPFTPDYESIASSVGAASPAIVLFPPSGAASPACISRPPLRERRAISAGKLPTATAV